MYNDACVKAGLITEHENLWDTMKVDRFFELVQNGFFQVVKISRDENSYQEALFLTVRIPKVQDVLSFYTKAGFNLTKECYVTSDSLSFGSSGWSGYYDKTKNDKVIPADKVISEIKDYISEITREAKKQTIDDEQRKRNNLYDSIASEFGEEDAQLVFEDYDL